MTKCKILTGRRAPQLEMAFNQWAPEDLTIKHMDIHDGMGQLIMAIIYEGTDNGTRKTIQDESEPEKEKTEAEEEVLASERCTVCAAVQFPTVVERGPYAGRHKCSVCNKTYDAQGLIPQDVVEENTPITGNVQEEETNG